MRTIKLFDTTLRDGEQGIGHLLSTEQKTRLLKEMINKKIDAIEIGMVTDEISHNLFKQASDFVKDTNIVALCRLHEKDIIRTVDALNCFTNPSINLLCIGSEIHLEKKMNMRKADGLALISTSVAHIDQAGFKGTTQAILEDSTRGSLRLLHDTIEHLIELGVNNICFADTTGAYTPNQTKRLFNRFVDMYPEVDFGCHFHNDMGLAVANSIIAIECGAKEVQVTIGGAGERCGNAALEEVLAVLENSEYHKKNFEVSADLKEIINLCQFYYDLLGKHPHDKKPLIGEHAFTTCAGIHQSAIIKSPETYEFINPEKLGLKRQFIFNRLSSNKIPR
ncbi:LeuA family protein [Vibrio sp. S4M6]|uniref:LeuA family protein n=1 Tax=Vibrio sinus TaxID=2946865 RepID=UPI002029E182|nr:LeuA family protein [Vibrio sinus]MCL9782230.1 LeuA family protein [Vibrio sinus]